MNESSVCPRCGKQGTMYNGTGKSAFDGCGCANCKIEWNNFDDYIRELESKEKKIR